jgi:hypothetical protein
MQPLMHDQPQPTCNSPQYDSGERGYGDHHDGQQQGLSERPMGGNADIFSGYLTLGLLQSSSASRFTAGAFGFFTFTQCGERPER